MPAAAADAMKTRRATRSADDRRDAVCSVEGRAQCSACSRSVGETVPSTSGGDTHRSSGCACPLRDRAPKGSRRPMSSWARHDRRRSSRQRPPPPGRAARVRRPPREDRPRRRCSSMAILVPLAARGSRKKTRGFREVHGRPVRESCASIDGIVREQPAEASRRLANLGAFRNVLERMLAERAMAERSPRLADLLELGRTALRVGARLVATRARSTRRRRRAARPTPAPTRAPPPPRSSGRTRSRRPPAASPRAAPMPRSAR